MALWGTFNWSDGTLWADAQGESGPATAFIDRSAHRVSLRVTHSDAAWPGSLSSFILQSASAEIGVRPQLPDHYEAFIDRNEESQRISIRVSHTAGEANELLTESEETILTESGEALLVDPPTPFAIDKIHGLIIQRSRRQPSG
jgi:hypothetical protein